MIHTINAFDGKSGIKAPTEILDADVLDATVLDSVLDSNVVETEILVS